MPLALIHDWLNQIGGAEDVLENLVRLFPGAPIYSSMYWPERMPASYREWDIRVSFMDRLPLVHRHHQPYLLLYPRAFESFDLSGHDLILSNKSGFCHGVRPAPGALHICYCLTPTRYVWGFDDYATREGMSAAARLSLRPFLPSLQKWDRAAAQRVDYFIAISSDVRRRIARFYERDSVVIYPPVDTARFAPAARHDDFFLVLGRLIPYKRADLAVAAFNELGLPLVIAGDGRDRPRLEVMAGPNIKFLGRVSDADAADLMARCRAFIFPGLEDFGIAPVQAMAAGRPVIAFAGGGALDTVVEGKTGLLFREQAPECLAAAVRALDDAQFNPAAIRKHAETFDKSAFDRQLREFIRLRANVTIPTSNL
ncbi:MAG: glycosyltransferase [Chloroflexi bacterium]|nr:glycosyltransferase [Chloroflexota bacterium]